MKEHDRARRHLKRAGREDGFNKKTLRHEFKDHRSKIYNHERRRMEGK